MILITAQSRNLIRSLKTTSTKMRFRRLRKKRVYEHNKICSPMNKNALKKICLGV